MTKYEYKKFQIKIGKTRRYRSTNTAAFKLLTPKAKLEFAKCKLCDILECLHAFEVRFCNKQTHTCRIFHSLTTIFIDEETIWFKKKTYIFVMIRAIFFGSNDLVSGSVVAVQEKNIPWIDRLFIQRNRVRYYSC